MDQIEIKKTSELEVDFMKFHKMAFIFNALDNGWTIKKKGDAYIFSKKHEGKKEVFLDNYLKFKRNEIRLIWRNFLLFCALE